MRRAIVVAALAVGAIAAAVALRYGVRRLDGVVAATVERYGSVVTGTDVDVAGVDLALTDGRADLAGITIGNPEGYETDYAVRIGHASVALDVGSLAGEVPVIDELTLDGALINAEQRDTASNLTDIQRHATASSGDAPPSTEPGRIIVKRFRLRDARVLLTSEHLSAPEELPLRDIVVDDIGAASGGATYSQAAGAMLAPVLAAARSAAGDRLKAVAAGAVEGAAREELEDDAFELREDADELRERRDELENDVSERVDELLDRG
jgi:hypothetical protein